MAGATLTRDLERAAKAIKEAQVLVVTAGAGMGVDSGLPDFRGPEGFWRAYPPLKDKQIKLANMSNPRWFKEDPKFAWGFFGHRYNLYTKANPHEGFQILRRWAEKMSHGYFVFTSNVDGHFQRAGFDEDRVVECHGSINFMQCSDDNVSEEIWPVPDDFHIEVDDSTLHAKSVLPRGPPGQESCLARPNILMFGDWLWVSDRTDKQDTRFHKFQDKFNHEDTSLKVAVIEIGAGLYVPTVRYTSESLVSGIEDRATLIRINPREPEVPKGHVSIPLGGLEALTKIQDILNCDKK